MVDEQKENPVLSLFGEVTPVKGKKSARIKAKKSALKQVPSEEVEQLFVFWRDTLVKKSLLSDERRAILAWAILNYGMETCEMAIKGCSFSDWHMGRNPNNVKYDSIELIFRNSEKVEFFVQKFQNSLPGQNEEPF